MFRHSALNTEDNTNVLNSLCVALPTVYIIHCSSVETICLEQNEWEIKDHFKKEIL
jgi:hypothetical protein